jgi:uncharacterized repeat protein (TIGR03803 family)
MQIRDSSEIYAQQGEAARRALAATIAERDRRALECVAELHSAPTRLSITATMATIEKRKFCAPSTRKGKLIRVLQAAALLAASGWAPNSAQAFTYNVLHTFSGFPNDGSQPLAGLARRGPGSTFVWGTTCTGGTARLRTIYRFDRTNPGATYSVTYNFGSTSSPVDGSCPAADLDYQVGRGGTFYGTTQFGGASAAGTVFQIKSNGTFPYTVVCVSGRRRRLAARSAGDPLWRRVVRYYGVRWNWMLRRHRLYPYSADGSASFFFSSQRWTFDCWPKAHRFRVLRSHAKISLRAHIQLR